MELPTDIVYKNIAPYMDTKFPLMTMLERGSKANLRGAFLPTIVLPGGYLSGSSYFWERIRYYRNIGAVPDSGTRIIDFVTGCSITLEYDIDRINLYVQIQEALKSRALTVRVDFVDRGDYVTQTIKKHLSLYTTNLQVSATIKGTTDTLVLEGDDYVLMGMAYSVGWEPLAIIHSRYNSRKNVETLLSGEENPFLKKHGRQYWAAIDNVGAKPYTHKDIHFVNALARIPRPTKHMVISGRAMYYINPRAATEYAKKQGITLSATGKTRLVAIWKDSVERGDLDGYMLYLTAMAMYGIQYADLPYHGCCRADSTCSEANCPEKLFRDNLCDEDQLLDEKANKPSIFKTNIYVLYGFLRYLIKACLLHKSMDNDIIKQWDVLSRCPNLVAIAADFIADAKLNLISMLPPKVAHGLLSVPYENLGYPLARNFIAKLVRCAMPYWCHHTVSKECMHNLTKLYKCWGVPSPKFIQALEDFGLQNPQTSICALQWQLNITILMELMVNGRSVESLGYVQV